MNKQKILDIMLDVETLGTSNNALLLQIAAVPFTLESGEVVGSTYFNQFINPSSCLNVGMDIDLGTITWWLKQDKSAIKKVLVEALLSNNNISQVLTNFNSFLAGTACDYDSIRLWGNGILSDNLWLTSAYTLSGVDNPFRHYQHNDVRTIVDLGWRFLDKDIKASEVFTGEKHNALDDCKHQIKYVTKIVKELTKRTR